GLVSRGSAGQQDFYDFDGTGSTAGLSGPGGAYANRSSYLPFGGSLSSTGTVANPFRFVGSPGGMTEGNGLDLMRRRFYSPGLGRFLSPDPMGLAGGQVNLYAYVANDPVNFIGPRGLEGEASEGVPEVSLPSKIWNFLSNSFGPTQGNQ